MDNWPAYVFGFFVSLFISGLLLMVGSCVHDNMRTPAVAARFQIDTGDLRAFLGNTDYSLSQFETSKGVRRNFERWRKGEGEIGRKTTTTVVPMIIPVSN